MVKWIGNIISGILVLPIIIGIIDMWWHILFNKMLIIEHWSSQHFTGAIILAACGLFVKIVSVWMNDK